VIGHTQTNRRGFGHGDIQWWSKATDKQRRDMVVQEVRETEESKRWQKAAQQVQQGQWTTWDEALQRSLSWNDIWHMAPLRLSFVIRSVYDLLPSATNLVKWGLSENTRCPLCTQRQTLEHVLSSCKTALGLGRYTWRHNRVLQDLAAIVDVARMKANSKVRPAAAKKYFLRAGQAANTQPSNQQLPSILDAADDWEIAVDLPGQGAYPDCIKSSNTRPDIVLHSSTVRHIILIELTVPFESRLEEQHIFKTAKYSDLATYLRRQGYIARIEAVEVGARGMVATTVYDLLKRLGVKGQTRNRALKKLAETAEKSSCWLWSIRDRPGDVPQGCP
jgi:hypothetical protein